MCLTFALVSLWRLKKIYIWLLRICWIGVHPAASYPCYSELDSELKVHLNQAEITQANSSQAKPQARQTHSKPDQHPTMSPEALLLDLHSANTPRRASSLCGEANRELGICVLCSLPWGQLQGWSLQSALLAASSLKTQHWSLPCCCLPAKWFSPCSSWPAPSPEQRGGVIAPTGAWPWWCQGRCLVSSSGTGRTAQRAPSWPHCN